VGIFFIKLISYVCSMTVAYLYLATDGINDFKKFGIAANANIRLINYNTTEHLRPIYFEKVFVFDSYNDARNAETTLRQNLKKYIIQTQHIETFVWNDETEKMFNELTKDFTLIEFTNDFVGNLQNKKFPYYEELVKLINYAVESGIPKKTVEKLVIKSRVGYYRENAPARIVMEDRIKHLVKLTNKELCWDNKPRILDRMQRLYTFEEEIKKTIG
jgi:hypothetical protein